jgi:anti-anti-sigma factor
MPKPHVEAVQDRGVLVLTIQDEELHSDPIAEALRQELLTGIRQSGLKKLVLDFRNVRFITTIAFQPLLSVRRKVNELGGQLLICELSPAVAEVFEVTRLISTKPGVLAAFDHEARRADAITRLSQSD